MSSYIAGVPIGAIIVAILFGSAMLAMAAAKRLPPHHMSSETKSVVSVSAAVVGTLSALVVGLLISTSSASFNLKSQTVIAISADAIAADRLLRRYGAETQPARALLQTYLAATMRDLFPNDRHRPPDLANETTLGVLDELQDAILALIPANDRQHVLQAQSLQLIAAIMEARRQLWQESAVVTPFALLLLVMIWFVVIFASFGLFAPRNSTAVAMILLCALAIGSAIRLTTELQTPFRGLIRVSSMPLAEALQTVSR